MVLQHVLWRRIPAGAIMLIVMISRSIPVFTMIRIVVAETRTTSIIEAALILIWGTTFLTSAVSLLLTLTKQPWCQYVSKNGSMQSIQ